MDGFVYCLCFNWVYHPESHANEMGGQIKALCLSVHPNILAFLYNYSQVLLKY